MALVKYIPNLQHHSDHLNLKNYNFKSSIFFSLCNIFVEGASDEAAIAAISDELDNVFEKFSIQIVSIGGKEVIEQYVPLLKYFSIPHLVLVDYDYHIDNNHNTKNRDTTSDFIILKARLEDVLTELNPSFRISEKDSVKPEAAYAIVSKEIKKESTKS